MIRMLRWTALVLAVSTITLVKCAINMPKDNVVIKEEYLKLINTVEFDCLKKCGSQNDRIPVASDESNDQRPLNAKCESRDIDADCKVDKSSLTPIHEGRYVLSTAKGTWHQALRDCRKLGLQLANMEAEALGRKLADYMTGKGLTGPYWSSGVTLVPGESSVWLENGAPVSMNVAGRKQAGFALSFSLDAATKKLKWTEEPVTKTNSYLCEVPDECYINRCVSAN